MQLLVGQATNLFTPKDFDLVVQHGHSHLVVGDELFQLTVGQLPDVDGTTINDVPKLNHFSHHLSLCLDSSQGG